LTTLKKIEIADANTELQKEAAAGLPELLPGVLSQGL